jgi:hypothetical protein
MAASAADTTEFTAADQPELDELAACHGSTFDMFPQNRAAVYVAATGRI